MHHVALETCLHFLRDFFLSGFRPPFLRTQPSDICYVQTTRPDIYSGETNARWCESISKALQDDIPDVSDFIFDTNTKVHCSYYDESISKINQYAPAVYSRHYRISSLGIKPIPPPLPPSFDMNLCFLFISAELS